MFTGMLSEEDKVRAYIDSVICAYLSRFEPFGIVPLEAAASGKPVIVSEGTPMANIVEKGRFGFSVKYFNINRLARTIAKVLNNEELLKDIGQNGRKFVFENYDWTNIITGLEKVYKDLAK